jgi:septum formation protein
VSHFEFILGSSSPRRMELLEQIGLAFRVVKPHTDEIIREGELASDYVIRNAEEKALWVGEHLKVSEQNDESGKEKIIISADTIVVLGEKTLEKPLDHQDAFRMLKALSGQTHTVMTGVTLIGPLNKGVSQGQKVPYDHTLQMVTFRVHTQVSLKTLADEEILSYIRLGEPLDKAGAYAAQGVGSYMVERIEGSYANVVGLPVCDVVKKLDEYFGLKLWELFPSSHKRTTT